MKNLSTHASGFGAQSIHSRSELAGARKDVTINAHCPSIRDMSSIFKSVKVDVDRLKS